MPSITARNKARIFASASNGATICLALKDFEAGDADSFVIFYSPSSPQPWRRLEIPFDVMDVALLPDPPRNGADYIALASTGEAIVLSDPLRVTRINPEGIFRVIEPGKGMLSAFDCPAGKLTALGRGGQAYRFIEPNNWPAVSATFPLEDDPTDHINFLCAGMHAGERALYFGGSAEPQTKSFDEITAALLRGDIEDFTNRIMTDVRAIYGTLWRLADDQWRKLDLPTSGTITSLLQSRRGRLLLSTNLGFAAEIVASDQIQGIYARSDQKNIALLTEWNDRTIVLLDDEIVSLDLTTGDEDSLPVPGGFEAMQNLHAGGDNVWLVDWRGLARWNGVGWDEIQIPGTLLR